MRCAYSPRQHGAAPWSWQQRRESCSSWGHRRLCDGRGGEQCECTPIAAHGQTAPSRCYQSCDLRIGLGRHCASCSRPAALSQLLIQLAVRILRHSWARRLSSCSGDGDAAGGSQSALPAANNHPARQPREPANHASVSATLARSAAAQLACTQLAAALLAPTFASATCVSSQPHIHSFPNNAHMLISRFHSPIHPTLPPGPP